MSCPFPFLPVAVWVTLTGFWLSPCHRLLLLVLGLQLQAIPEILLIMPRLLLFFFFQIGFELMKIVTVSKSVFVFFH